MKGSKTRIILSAIITFHLLTLMLNRDIKLRKPMPAFTLPIIERRPKQGQGLPHKGWQKNHLEGAQRGRQQRRGRSIPCHPNRKCRGKGRYSWWDPYLESMGRVAGRNVPFFFSLQGRRNNEHTTAEMADSILGQRHQFC